MSTLDTTLRTTSKVAQLCLAVLIICSLPVCIGLAIYAAIKTELLQTTCNKAEAACELLGAKTGKSEVQNSAKTVVDRVDGNHNKLLNSLSEKFQFVVDSNKNTTSEILEVILAQHNQTRHELASRTDALALMHQQLLNVTLTQMKTVAQDCSLDVLAKIFPRLDAINATLRLNLDKEIALKEALGEVAKLERALETARSDKAAVDAQLNDPWTSLIVMIALALCVADDKDMSNTVCVVVFWVGYKIACWVGLMWPLTPLCALLVPVSGGLLMAISKFGSKRAHEPVAGPAAVSTAPAAVSTGPVAGVGVASAAAVAAAVEPAIQDAIDNALKRKFIKQQNYRRFVEDERRISPPPSYVTSDE